MSIDSVAISSPLQDCVNTNSELSRIVAEGFSSFVPTVSIVPITILYAHILKFRPSVVILLGSVIPNAASLYTIRKACDTTKTILCCWLYDEPYEFDFQYRTMGIADYLFINDRWATYASRHPKAFYLPLAASPTMHYREFKDYDEREIDCFYCGVAFQNRKNIFLKAKNVLAKYKTTIYGEGWPEDMPFAINQRITTNQLMDAYADSKINFYITRRFNLANHRFDLAPTYGAPRLFEAAMAGVAQLLFVDSLEVMDFFEPGKEILLFDSIDDIANILEKLVFDHTEIEQIAKNAQQRALKEHTYSARAQRILEIILGT